MTAMTTRLGVRAGLLATLILTVAACGSTNSPSAAASPSPSPSAAPLVKTATATVAGASQTVLVGASTGMTLYYFTPDKGGKITCTGQCLVNWPALLLPSGQTTVTATSEIPGKFTTVTNAEANGLQVLYNTWPLYFWVKDKQAGDATGQGVNGKWFVATPSLAAPSA
jgi:predicted lipoprotein with Yx(FWY)xxD motif